jgi:hypothetical protein
MPDVASCVLNEPLPLWDDLQTANILLGKLHEGTTWRIELFRPSGDGTADISVLHHSYILFVWNEKASSLNETLENQVENLKESTSWNTRGRFLWWQLTSAMNRNTYRLLTYVPYKWQVARIVNVVVLIPNQFPYCPLHAMRTTNATAADRMNLHTWFPFKLERCGEVQEVILLD